MEKTTDREGLYPPSFCHWRLALGVMAVTQVSVFLIALGRFESVGWQWLLMTSTYAQTLGLLCAAGICLCRPWLKRMTPRGAWAGSWVIAVLLALAFSYGAGVVGTVLGVGPGRENLGDFVLESLVATGMVMVALLRYQFMHAQWQAQLTAQADARVQALQSRIRPHFLFNSLNTIASLIHDEPDSAERATEDLADLFRGSMQRADRLIPLADELRLARQFLDMETRRLGERLQVEWAIEALPGDARVFPLLLQPLLENAVKHGIQRRQDGGIVRVYGRAEPGCCVITVRNPLPPEDVTDHRDAGQGMALDNIRNRLDLAWGEAASLVTNQDTDHFYAVLSFPHVEDTNRR